MNRNERAACCECGYEFDDEHGTWTACPICGQPLCRECRDEHLEYCSFANGGSWVEDYIREAGDGNE